MNQDVSSVLGSQLSGFDLTNLDQPGLPPFGELVMQVVSGEIDLSLPGVMAILSRLVFNEFFTNTHLIRQLLVVAILSALLKCLSDAFKHKAAGDLGFYVTFCIMMLLAISSFRLSAEILLGLLSTINSMMEAAIPLIVSLMAVSGNVAGAAVFHPALFFAIGLITRFISYVFIPLLMAAVGLTAASSLAEGNPLEKLAGLLKKGADWTLKAIIGLFALLLALQKFGAPIINSVALKTTKSAVGAIPVVGGALSAAMDTVLFWGQAGRSGVMVALVVVLCVALAVPLAKMLVLMLVYRLIAAVVQPICDDRFTGCLEAVGGIMGAMMSAGVMVGVMCVYAVIMLLSF